MPAFLKELISTVRLGRTSGMHLILATQNPAADINSDIRGNLKSHILLRVNADHDSMTVIRSAAAARTDIKGRAFMQSGSAPAIEFQTASARGLYNPENRSSTSNDLVLYDMERVVAPVQSNDEPATSANSVMKAVIEAVDHIHDSWQVSELPKVLPDPLPSHLCVGDLLACVPNRWDSDAQAWHGSSAANPISRAPLGLMDDIESQLIRTLEFALDETADHLLIASPRSFGKTSALLTLARSIATCWRPDEVMLYGLNFAARDLDILEDLPHIGAVINKDETERIDRLFIWLEEELQRRARQLSITRKATVWQYNAWARAATPEQRKQLPYLAPIVVLLDGGAEFMNSYLMQTHDFAAMTHQVARILRDGRNLGVIFAVSVSSSNDLPDDLFKLMQSRRIVMGLSTTPEYVGYFNEMPERDSYFRPGAGLMSGSPLLQVQVALPETTHNLERLSQGFKAMAAAAERQQITPAAASIEALPGDVRLDGEPSPANRIPTTGLMHWVAQARPPAEHMRKYPSVRAILGVSGRDQAPLVVEMRPGAHYVAASAPQGGKTTLLKSFTYSAAWLNGPQALQISVIDPAGEFSWMRRLPHVQWLTGAQEITDCIKNLQRESLHRSQKVSELFVKLSDEMDEASSASIEDLCMIHHQPHLVVIDNYERLSAVVPNLNAGVLTNIAQNANRTRIHFLVSVPASGYSADQFVSYLLSKRSGFAVGSLEAVNLLGRLTSALIRQKLPMGRGYVVKQDEMTLAQFCRIGDERAVMQKITQQWGSAAPAPATPGISDTLPAVTESPDINGEPVEISTPQYQTILDEPFDPEQEIVETLRFLNESYPYYEKLPDVQDVLAAYESQQDEDTHP
jgi:S-DNA-T family DNA segregation ATPase FtsK/SpoIIIE